MDSDRDDRKSARIAAANFAVAPGARVVGDFAAGREILRSPAMRQAIEIGAGHFDLSDPDTTPVIFLDGEAHRAKRSAIARFFTPKAVATRHRAVMERATEALIAGLRKRGEARLDVISFELAVAVAADIVGLTSSNQSAMARRLAKRFAAGTGGGRRSGIGKAIDHALLVVRSLEFLYRDVRPAIAARRKAPQDDVISQLLANGASDKTILIECQVYASAGMVTTREFIVMAAWHLFERGELRERFLAAGDEEQLRILDEILRLEPVVGMVFRKPTDGEQQSVIDIRAANVDEGGVGARPNALDPDRGAGSGLSFGDGPHRCPGAQVALHETRVFLDGLLRVPGIRLSRAPEMIWNANLMSYELRDAMVSCDRPT